MTEMWNFMMLETVPADLMVRPMIGPGAMTREQAHSEVQALLDRIVGDAPDAKPAAETWRAGAVDDTVGWGPFAWTIYAYPAGEDPRVAAIAWIDDYAETIRNATGLQVGVYQLPD